MPCHRLRELAKVKIGVNAMLGMVLLDLAADIYMYSVYYLHLAQDEPMQRKLVVG